MVNNDEVPWRKEDVDEEIWHHYELTRQVRANVPPVPDYPISRGIVICGGGEKYFPPAWVCIRMLRHVGCTLPIQLWHLGEKEMTEEMRKLIEPYGVETVDALEVRKKVPARTLNGWELKPYAILNSPYESVLLLDADNMPVMNPEYLFETPQFIKDGAIFWPDWCRLAPDRSIWKACGVLYRDEEEFESGQIVVNKKQCWEAMHMAMHMNEYSDFYYRHMHGDKETFHMGFRRVGKPYAVPGYGMESVGGTVCQHDFEGRRIFQHRNTYKWTLGENRPTPGFFHEELCLSFLQELKKKWGKQFSKIAIYDLEKSIEPEREAAKLLTSNEWVYSRVGLDCRVLSFGSDGQVRKGRADCEQYWNIVTREQGLVLQLQSAARITCELFLGRDRIWRGRWLYAEECETILTAQVCLE